MNLMSKRRFRKKLPRGKNWSKITIIEKQDAYYMYKQPQNIDSNEKVMFSHKGEVLYPK